MVETFGRYVFWRYYRRLNLRYPAKFEDIQRIYRNRKPTKTHHSYYRGTQKPLVTMRPLMRDENVFADSVCMYPVTFAVVSELFDRGSPISIADITSSFLRYRKPQKKYTFKQARQYFKRFGLDLK